MGANLSWRVELTDKAWVAVIRRRGYSVVRGADIRWQRIDDTLISGKAGADGDKQSDGDDCRGL